MEKGAALDVTKDVGEYERRLQLRVGNIAAACTSPVIPSGILDANLKKHATFLARLRTALNATGCAQLLGDIRKLKLEKHVSECAPAIMEGLGKCKSGDVGAAVEVVSGIHQRFPDTFTPDLSNSIKKWMKPMDKQALKMMPTEQREREEKERVTRQRGWVRVVVELWLCGVFYGIERKESSEEGWLFDIFSDLLVNDKDFSNVTIAVQLAKIAGRELLGVWPRRLQPHGVNAEPISEKHAAIYANVIDTDPCVALVTEKQRKAFAKLLTSYFQRISTQLVKGHAMIQKREKKNDELMINRGEVPEDAKLAHERAMKGFEKLLSAAQTLSDALDMDLPEFAKDNETEDTFAVKLEERVERVDQTGDGLWEDEDQRRFYEDLVDLKIKVPGILLEVKKGASSTVEATSPKSGLAASGTLEDMKRERSDTVQSAAEDGGLLVRVDEEDGDERGAVTDFTEPLKSATTTGQSAKLEQLLASLLNMCNRDLIDQATVDFCYLNTKNARKRLAQLEKEFRGHMRWKKRGDRVDSRIKALHEDFNQASLEVLCSFLECCGRFLYKLTETHEFIALTLDSLMKKKKAALNLDPRILVLIDNAYFTCIPPANIVRQEKVRSAIDLFIRKLILADLAKVTVETILKQLRMLPWDEPWVFERIHNLLVKPWRIKYGDVHLYALIVAGLHRYHPEFGIGVVDRVLEDTNKFKWNQRRVATVRYLGELYNYRVVDSSVIFDTLYLIVSFGYPSRLPSPGAENAFDTANDFFRARLICTLLETCGIYFNKGIHRKKLDAFLLFFQLFLLSKNSIPMEVEFMISDTFELLRPDFKRYTAYAEVLEQVLKVAETEREDAVALKMNASMPEENEDFEPTERDAEDFVDDSNGSDSTEEEGMLEEDSQEDDDDVSAEDRSSEEGESDDDDYLDFDFEFNRMLASSDGHKRDKKGMALDVAIPLHLKGKKIAADTAGESQVQFTMLTRKAGKQQLKTVEVPVESVFATNVLQAQAAKQQEQQQLKRLVLNYEERGDGYQKVAPIRTITQRTIKRSDFDGSKASQRQYKAS